ncbi:MAG: Coenzyme F420 hydrogenase/dehydrogenase, beta subunit C-terminal domain [Microbacterium sp.]|nr:Coenzyme F420 hydrogenase/dehydrogenase, beta subunit C-terminal domain [Microbacterium sp.]
MTDLLAEGIEQVVSSGRCSGCGLCAQLDPRIRMVIDAAGYNRPVVGDAPAPAEDRQLADATRFRASCPGEIVAAADVRGPLHHSLVGSAFGAWRAWATDEAIRAAGSSGGVLTALAALLIDGGAPAISAAAAPPTSRTVPIRLTTREEAMRSAGSRYAPVGNLAHPEALTAPVFIGKPCEASALRRATGADAPLILSFFCAGVPSQQATDSLIEHLGADPARVRSLRYRGGGWPGTFRVEDADGRIGEASYDDSWGRWLGPTTQWRCKICVDGVGELADVVASDLWESDASGYPVFDDRPGVSALIARTQRGLELVERAIAEGVLEAEPVTLAEIIAIQPLQRERRTTLFGRLLGARLTGARVPRYPGFGLLGIALLHPLRNARGALGTVRRALRSRRRGA